jgi:lipopolysaccharide/colanic/teichoic acid biosynthesis glycosyltransferase
MKSSKKVEIYLKYYMDKLFSIIGLIILSPIFLLIGLILKFQGEDIFFLQKRIGYLGEEFEVFKFTTMPKGSEKLGLITTPNDPRTSKLGKFLRKTSLNEVPQLINILKGDMSFVGPRPLVQIKKYLNDDETIKYYRMRPGITGLASLYYYEEDELLGSVENSYEYYEKVIMPKKQKLEDDYYKNYSTFLDVKIIFLTLKKVLYDRYK